MAARYWRLLLGVPLAQGSLQSDLYASESVESAVTAARFRRYECAKLSDLQELVVKSPQEIQENDRERNLRMTD
jgi:hypothetical protein